MYPIIKDTDFSNKLVSKLKENKSNSKNVSDNLSDFEKDLDEDIFFKDNVETDINVNQENSNFMVS
ncbi:MAG: hypothetical protein IPP65_10755 [Chlorobi bacterium]|nr:hypothetical protein [Chlorobiota bacterium]